MNSRDVSTVEVRGETEIREIIGAAAFAAVVFTALPASAQPNDPYDYPYCLQGGDFDLPGVCQFTSYLRCEATAWGTRSYCGPNPSICILLVTARPMALSGTVIELLCDARLDFAARL